MNIRNAKKLDEALKNINNFYQRLPTGCVAYYDSALPSKWEDAHNLMENSLMSRDEFLISNQITIFEATILQLMKRYQSMKNKTKEEVASAAYSSRR